MIDLVKVLLSSNLHQHDPEKLTYKKIEVKALIYRSLLLIVFSILATSYIFYQIGRYNGVRSIDPDKLNPIEKEILIENTCEDTFSEEKLYLMLKEYNVKFPHIVMSQSILESNNFKSGIFMENSNLFGMKEARSRPTTATGTNRSHAMYRHWRESVYDYIFYQCRYLGKIKTEEEYYQYLGENYAEAERYVQSVKRIIKEKELHKLFYPEKYEDNPDL